MEYAIMLQSRDGGIRTEYELQRVWLAWGPYEQMRPKQSPVVSAAVNQSWR